MPKLKPRMKRRNSGIFASSLGIVSIDLAINKTGMALFDNEGSLVKLGLLSTKKHRVVNENWQVIRLESEDFERYYEVRDKILALIQSWNTIVTVDCIVLEDFSYGSTGRSVFDIGMLNGIVRDAIYTAGYKLELLSPSAIKKAVAGKGNAPKDVLAMKVYQLYNIDLGCFGKDALDLYDAIAVGHTFLKSRK